MAQGTRKIAAFVAVADFEDQLHADRITFPGMNPSQRYAPFTDLQLAFADLKEEPFHCAVMIGV
jgi:hypothetical protein